MRIYTRRTALFLGFIATISAFLCLVSFVETWRHLFGYCVTFYDGQCHDVMLDPMRTICTLGALVGIFAAPFALRGMFVR